MPVCMDVSHSVLKFASLKRSARLLRGNQETFEDIRDLDYPFRAKNGIQ